MVESSSQTWYIQGAPNSSYRVILLHVPMEPINNLHIQTHAISFWPKFYQVGTTKSQTWMEDSQSLILHSSWQTNLRNNKHTYKESSHLLKLVNFCEMTSKRCVAHAMEKRCKIDPELSLQNISRGISSFPNVHSIYFQ